MYLGLPILDISKKGTYEVWYDYVQPNYRKKAKLCYTETNSFIFQEKLEDIYACFVVDVKKKFGKSNYEFKWPLPIGKKPKKIEQMKDVLRWKAMKGFVSLRPKMCSYLTDDRCDDKKAKGTQKCFIQQVIRFESYKNYLENNKTMLGSQQTLWSEVHYVSTEKVDKITLDYRSLIEWSQIHMVQVLEENAKQNWCDKQKQKTEYND